MTIVRVFRPAVAIAVAALLLAAAGASAATRYAAPGGTGADPCADPDAPCSIYTAGSVTAPGTTVQGGDEVILEAGEYSDSAGDLGPDEFVQLAQGIQVHGAVGHPRPLIRLDHGTALIGAFIVEAGDTLSHVEIDTSVSRSNLEVFGGLVEDLIARNTSNASQSTACVHVAGTIRDSACLASADFSAAVGESTLTAADSTATLRNVTAIDTGTSSRGLSYTIFGSGSVTVSAKAVVAKGTAFDVVAEGLGFPLNTPGTGGEVTINLDHSDFSTKEAFFDSLAGGTASVTSPAANSNVTEAPLLAADGYHELAGSPTIGAGAVDGSSGAADIDGQERTIGAQADIGADEFGNQTTLSLACDPPKVVPTDALPGSGTDCTATVTDEAEGILPLSGTVSFSSGGKGEFVTPTCTLTQPALSDHASCAVNYKPKIGGAGTHAITAAFAGDARHDGSQGGASVLVEERPFGCSGPAATCLAQPPNIRLETKPAKRTAKRLARFGFSSDQPSASFECKLDKKTFKRCRSPYKRRVAPGRHSFSVRAVGPGGTSKPVTYRWRVLRPAPR